MKQLSNGDGTIGPGQWIEQTPQGYQYYDGLNLGFVYANNLHAFDPTPKELAEAKVEALECLRLRREWARSRS